MRGDFAAPAGKRLVLVSVLLLGCWAAGCKRGAAEDATVHEMGKAVNAGPLSYTVYQTEWRDELSTEMGPRKPQHRFLLLTVSVTNNGTEDAGVPLLNVIDESGKETMELDKGDGVPQWMGVLRRIPSTQTENGVLLFDVPPGNYKLKVSSGGDVEKEKTALIGLPYRVEAPMARPVEAEAPGKQ